MIGVAAGVYILVLSIGGVYVPSDFEGRDARFRYRHECEAVLQDWRRFGYRGDCLEVKPDGLPR